MPYIEQFRRDELDQSCVPENCGELNYAITKLLLQYLATNGRRYQTMNDCLGALDGAGKEFYRRYVAPYEDEKIVQNGDVQ